MIDVSFHSNAVRALPLRRARSSIVVPMLVLCLTAGLLVWSAWPVFSPVRSVVATQAVFDQSSGIEADQPDGAAPTRGGPTIQAAGWVEPEPFYIACTALADGVIETIESLEGDTVEQGQIVARLIATDSELRLRRADAVLTEAKSALALTDAEMRAAVGLWEEPVALNRELEMSRAMLAGSEAELAQLPMRLTAARADLRRLESERDWMAKSETGGAATELELITSRERAAAQRAEVEALEASRPVLEARIEQFRAELRAAERELALRFEDRKRVDASQASVRAAEARLLIAEAERDEAALELERMIIRAPRAGTVMRRYKSPGDKVVRGMDDPYSAHILHLYDPAQLQVRVDVPLADVSGVFVGQECQIVVEALPGVTLRGEVIRILHEADVQKNTLEVKVRVIDPPPLVRPEMLTRVKFVGHDSNTEMAASTERSARTLLVPAEALWSNDEGAYVWAVTKRRAERGVLRAVPVEHLAEHEGWVSVTGDLQPGAILAIAQKGLREGQSVAVRFAEMEGGS